jgi:predicted nucleic acid-binding protein
MQRPQLVAIDTNIVLALGEADEDTADLLQLILQRVAPSQILLCPTVLQEASYLSVNGDTVRRRRMAREGLRRSAGFRFHPSTLNAVQRALVDNAARCLLNRGLLPAAELNDARILSEAAVLNCVLLVSKDSHLLRLDHLQVNLLLRELDLSAPVIATPRELLRKSYS